MAWNASFNSEAARAASLDVRRNRRDEMLMYIIIRLAQGSTTRIIGGELGLASASVHNRVCRGIQAYGVTTRLELFAQFMRDERITVEDLRSVPKVNEDWFYRAR